jgi:hypothetical protein
MMREYRLRKKASKLVAEKAKGLPQTLNDREPLPTFERDGENASLNPWWISSLAMS